MNRYRVHIAAGEHFSPLEFTVYADGIGPALATAIDAAMDVADRDSMVTSAYLVERDVASIRGGPDDRLLAKAPETRSSRVPVVTLTDEEMAKAGYQCDGLGFDSGRALRCKRNAKVRVGLETLCRQHAGMVALTGAIDRRAL